MRKIIVIIIILFLGGHISIDAQTIITSKTASGKLKKLYDTGVRLSFNGQLEAALKNMDKILEIAPNFIDAQIQWSNLQYDLGNLEAAAKGFEKVLTLDLYYAENVPYNLGLIKWNLEEFEASAKYFNQYLSANPRSEKRKKRAKVYAQNAAFAAKAIKEPVPFEPINLGLNINSARHEYFPSLTADGESLIYTAVVNGQEDFYKSKRSNEEWQKGVPITGVNTPLNEGAQSISADGRFLVFTACERKEGMGGCELYFSEYKNGRWTKQQNIGAPVNSSARETQPSISADGQRLYFASNRKGTQGKMDLWVSHRQTNGTWGEPQNLGNNINTSGDERTPFIHPDGQTLYFMSDGHPGMGGMDIYFSRKQADGTWGKPQNMGYPINTKEDAGFLVVDTKGETAYFASDRSDYAAAQGRFDIYSFEMPEGAKPLPVTYAKGIIRDEESRKKLSAKIDITDLQTGEIISTRETDDGTFLMTLLTGKDYMLTVSKEQYLFHSENFALSTTYDLDKPFLLKVDLLRIPEASNQIEGTSITKRKPIILKNVFFDTGSAVLLPTSISELNRLKNLLENYPDLSIQINGHTDNVGTEVANLDLSSKRAKAVQDWLIANKIAAERLSFAGFGETKPIASNTTEAGRKENRRVAFWMVE